MRIPRRTALIGASALAIRPVLAGGPPHVTIFSHPIHKTVATGALGGDITAAWVKRTGGTVEWVTFDVEPLHDRLMREASLPEGSADIGLLLNSQITPHATSLLEPLDGYQQSAPIEKFGDIFPALVDAMRIDGKLYAIPFRHTSDGLHVNQTIFEERGIAGPPKTIEEFADIAKRCVYTRANGTQVTGLVLPGGLEYYTVCDFYRAWDGEFITRDMRVTVNEAPVVNAITMLRELYLAHAIPRNFTTITIEDTNVWMQTGRSAMIITGMSRNALFNDPAKSQFPGKILTTTIPVARQLLGKYPIAPAKTEIWAMAIPRNSRNKAAAWDLMREMVSPEAQVMTALNGNGPVRQSAYEDPRIRTRMPFAAEERRVLEFARVPMPAFDNVARVGAIFKEEAEAAVLGLKAPQQAMDDVASRVKPLLT